MFTWHKGERTTKIGADAGGGKIKNKNCSKMNCSAICCCEKKCAEVKENEWEIS